MSELTLAQINSIRSLDPVSDEQIRKCYQDCITRLQEIPPRTHYSFGGKLVEETADQYGRRLISRERAIRGLLRLCEVAAKDRGIRLEQSL